MKHRFLLVSLVIVIVGVMFAACAPSSGTVSADMEAPVAVVADEGDMDDEGMDDDIDDADLDDDDMDDDGEDQDDHQLDHRKCSPCRLHAALAKRNLGHDTPPTSGAGGFPATIKTSI